MADLDLNRLIEDFAINAENAHARQLTQEQNNTDTMGAAFTAFRSIADEFRKRLPEESNWTIQSDTDLPLGELRFTLSRGANKRKNITVIHDGDGVQLSDLSTDGHAVAYEKAYGHMTKLARQVSVPQRGGLISLPTSEYLPIFAQELNSFFTGS